MYRHSLCLSPFADIIYWIERGDIQALLDGLAAELGAPVLLDDVEQRSIAHTAHGDVIDDVRRAAIIGRRTPPPARAWLEQCGIRESREPLRTAPNEELGALERWCFPVRFRGIHLGYVWVLEHRELTGSELSSAVEIVEEIGVMLYRQRLAGRVDADLLRLLLMPSRDDAEVAVEARVLVTRSHRGPVVVMVAGGVTDDELPPPTVSDLELAVRRVAETFSAGVMLAAVIADHAVLIARLREQADMLPARRLAERLQELTAQVSEPPGLELVVGIGGVTELENASNSYIEAQRTLRIARAIPDVGPIVAWDELGAYRALALFPAGELVDVALDSRVRSLLQDSGLASTAETFLDLAGSPQEVSASLYVHRTTLYQRLERIKALYGLDLRRNGDHRLVTHLGLKVARLAGWPEKAIAIE